MTLSSEQKVLPFASLSYFLQLEILPFQKQKNTLENSTFGYALVTIRHHAPQKQLLSNCPGKLQNLFDTPYKSR